MKKLTKKELEIVFLKKEEELSHSGLEWGSREVEYEFCTKLKSGQKYFCPDLSAIIWIKEENLEQEYIPIEEWKDYISMASCIKLADIYKKPKYYFVLLDRKYLRNTDFYASFFEEHEARIRKGRKWVDFEYILENLPDYYCFTSHSGKTRYDDKTIKKLIYPMLKALEWVN